MKKSLTTIIKPFGKALQGIAFWVSYNKMYFNNHKLQEAPITLEFCKLLQSNFTDGQNVFQEEMLKKIYHSDVKTMERVDLLIKDKNRKELFAIEFKTDVTVGIEKLVDAEEVVAVVVAISGSEADTIE